MPTMERELSASTACPSETATSMKRERVSDRSGSVSRQAENGTSELRINGINLFVLMFLSFVT